PPTSDTPKPADLRSQFNTNVHNATPKQKKTRSLRPYIYATIFLLFGLTVGHYVRLVIAPPPLPLPGSNEDRLMIGYLKKEAEKLPLVKSLTGNPSWTHEDAYASFPTDGLEHRLPTGPLAGARAMGGFQRVFYNAETGECITVVWFGGALAGWPGVTHGGVIATILDESLGRCAVWKLAGHTGVTATLQLNYLKPVVSNTFYIIRAIPQEENATAKKRWVTGQLETTDGRVCVEAKGLFVVPKNYKTQPL
ncbi:hypothetical protein OIDMADRAFT_85018, partial [Oidiodendron maius Zn]